jgi:hypothetical protein
MGLPLQSEEVNACKMACVVLVQVTYMEEGTMERESG